MTPGNLSQSNSPTATETISKNLPDGSTTSNTLQLFPGDGRTELWLTAHIKTGSFV